MPTYDYECEACGHKLEAFHAMSADPLVDCPGCGQPKLIKQIGMGAAAIVKGSENPCRGSRGGGTKKGQRMTPKAQDKLGEGKNKGEKPFWRDGDVNKDVLKNPERYIKEGKVD